MSTHADSLDRAARLAWERFVAALERLVDETRAVLGPHLRAEIALRRGAPGIAAVDIDLGHGRVELKADLRCAPPSPVESALAARFGAETAVFRVRVLRRGPDGEAHLEGLVAADPRTRRWLALPEESEPASLDDPLAFERFLWGLLVDHGEETPSAARTGAAAG